MEAKRKDVMQLNGLNKIKEEAVLLQMGIILEKYIRNHEGDVYIIPAPAPVSVKPKKDNNNAASAINATVV